jgi:predicted methyltransferase
LEWRGAVALAAVGLVLVGLTAGSSLAQQSILDDPSRPDADKARDAGSKPLEVYEWLGITTGMTVGDVVPASGYNSHILAGVVGEGGHVLSVFTSDSGKAGLEERFTSAGVDNVEVLLNLDDVPDNSVDAFICVRNVHDMLIPDVAERFGMQPDPILGGILRTLKPGGIFGVVDARTTNEGVDANTHRINEKMMIDELEARGFELVDSSDLLAKPDDDYSQASFEGDGRYTLDRMLLKFRKPSM